MRRRAPRTQMTLPGILPAQARFPYIVGKDENPWATRALTRVPQPGAKVTGLMALEICAGAGGQALGFEQAGIGHAGLVEIDGDACATLRLNRPAWRVVEAVLNRFDGKPFKGLSVLSRGRQLSTSWRHRGHRTFLVGT
jgi:hypothetical protein